MRSKIDELLTDAIDRMIQEEPFNVRVWTSNIDRKRLFEMLETDNDFCTRLVIKENMGDSNVGNKQFPSGRIDETVGFDSVGYLRRAVEERPERAWILKVFKW